MGCYALWSLQHAKYFHESNESSFTTFIGKFMVLYFDDILIFSSSVSEHISHLEDVLTVLRRERLFTAEQKCQFGSNHVLFLGYNVSSRGLWVYQYKLKAIKSSPKPRTVTNIRSFHGLRSLYRHFVSHFISIMVHITNCMRADKFEWIEEAAQAFDVIKAKLATAWSWFYPHFLWPLSDIVMPPNSG